VLVPAGGNCKTVHVRIKLLALDTSHFTGAGWNTGLRYRSFGRKATLEEIIVEKFAVQLHARFEKAVIGRRH